MQRTDQTADAFADARHIATDVAFVTMFGDVDDRAVALRAVVLLRALAERARRRRIAAKVDQNVDKPPKTDN